MKHISKLLLSLVAIAPFCGVATAATPDLSTCDEWRLACSGNYTNASRPSSNPINYVVIHKVQGSAASAASWFQNCAANVSAHFTYNNSTGYCYQSVYEADIAYHAGNWTYNQQSVGIEHGGYVTSNDTSAACYDESAIETRSCIIYYSVLHNRNRIVGHSEVPGASHTDPGVYWNWTYYMSKCNPNSSTPTGSDKPVVGDWDGNGTVTVGVFRDGRSWYIRNSNTNGGADSVFNYGDGAGDVAIAGDWDGNGTMTPSIFRNGTWYLKNSNTGGVHDITFAFGSPGDVPIAGDWDGNGTWTIGVVRGTVWYLRNSNSAGAHNITFNYGDGGDKPVVGDWDGNGTFTCGIFRPGVADWHLRNSNSAGPANGVFHYGQPQDIPVTGDWNNDGYSTVGIKRGAEWHLRNNNFSGPADIQIVYGN